MAGRRRCLGCHDGEVTLDSCAEKAYKVYHIWCYLGSFALEFEFDEEKSLANKEKHGIDFVEAQFLWLDSMLVEIPARTVDEPRYLVVGLIAGVLWSAVITHREDRIRIISVRRSRREEVDIYEGA